jgi:hypothetical protein
VALLKNKSVRDKIWDIDNSRMRLNLLQKSLLDPDFAMFADEALKTLNKNKLD